MNSYISCDKFELKYFFYCVLFVVIEIYINFFIFNEGNIITDHNLLYSFCFFFGYLLNIIPAWISHKLSKGKENLITNKLEKENIHSIEYIYNRPYEKYLSTKKS